MTLFNPFSNARKINKINTSKSLDFVASSGDKVTIGGTVNVGSNVTYSLSFFMKVRTAGSAGRIIIGASGGLDIFTTGTNALQIGHNGVGSASSNNVYDSNVWVHLVITWDLTNVRIYRNGVLFQTIAKTTNPAGSGGMVIGSYLTNTFNGRLQQIRLYKSRVLTISEVIALYRGSDISSTGLTFYFKTDEGSGSSLNDSSGNGNTGTISGPTWSTDSSVNIQTRVPVKSFVSRGFTSSVLFDGTTGIIRLGTNNAFTGDITFGCWMYWNGENGGYQTIFSKRDAYLLADLQFSLNLISTTNYIANDTIASYVNFNTRIPEKQWFFFSWVRNTTDSTENIYVNGSLLSSKTMGTFGDGIGAEISIGGTQNPSIDWFNGYMKEIYISATALTPSELFNLSNGTLPSGTPFCYLPANEGTGTTLNDSGAGNHDGTIDGATWSTFVPTGGLRSSATGRIVI